VTEPSLAHDLPGFIMQEPKVVLLESLGDRGNVEPTGESRFDSVHRALHADLFVAAFVRGSDVLVEAREVAIST
jgi:hypothetical protein